MCDHHADCIDLDGKYDCKCHIGYAGNGFECINIDECVTSTFLCPADSGEILRDSFYLIHFSDLLSMKLSKSMKSRSNEVLITLIYLSGSKRNIHVSKSNMISEILYKFFRMQRYGSFLCVRLLRRICIWRIWRCMY